MQLRAEYLNKILLDTDEEPHLTYKIIDVTFYDMRKPHCWEATCVPVERQGDGSYVVPSVNILKSGGIDTYRPSSLWGCCLVDMGDPKNPVKKDYVDEYIAAHEAA